MADSNYLLIIISFIVAVVAIYILYSIIIFQGNNNKNGSELQLSTKNILEQVEVLFEKREYALIQLLATKYLERVPGHTDVRIYLAKAYYADKKYNQAIRQCAIILKKKPYNIDTRKVLGDCYIKKQELTKAIREYDFLYEKKGNDKDIVRTLAELYRETEQTYSAITVYNALTDLLDVDAEIAEVQSIVAELNEEIHNYPAAFEAYKRRLGIYPTDVDTNKKLTELYIKIKNYPVAIETLLYMLSFVTEPKNLLWVYETLVSLYVESENYVDKNLKKLAQSSNGNGISLTTGAADQNCNMNIYDIAGNVWEYTFEYTESTGDAPCVCRGGAYNDATSFEGPASIRGSCTTADSDSHIGFRLSLY